MSAYKEARLLKCQTCGFVFSQRNPTEKELSDYYAKYSYSDNYYLSPLTSLRYERLLDEFALYKKNNRILDIGCGNGQFLEVAKKKGWEIWGTEYSKEAVLQAQKKGLNVLHGRLDEVLDDLPKFDVITSFEVIEHIINPESEIDLMKNILGPGGVVYITTPNFNSVLRYLLKQRYDVITYPEHLSYFTRKTLNYLMKEKGFDVKRIETTGFSLSRLKSGFNKSKSENPFTPVSTDEVLRNYLESNKILQYVKSITNKIFTISGTGLSLKGLFVKKE